MRNICELDGEGEANEEYAGDVGGDKGSVDKGAVKVGSYKGSVDKGAGRR